MRQWHQEGKSIHYYVPEAVVDYIEKHQIYHFSEMGPVFDQTEGDTIKMADYDFIKMQKKLAKYLEKIVLHIHLELCIPALLWLWSMVMTSKMHRLLVCFMTVPNVSQIRKNLKCVKNIKSRLRNLKKHIRFFFMRN